MSTRGAARRAAVAGAGSNDDSDDPEGAAEAEAEDAATAEEEEVEEDEDRGAAPDLSDEPKSVNLTLMECRVAVMTALGNNNPVTAPYGECSRRCNLVSEELKLYRSTSFPNGMKARLGTVKKMMEIEHAAFEKRENSQQFTTGSHLAESNAELDNAVKGAIETYTENVRFDKLSRSQKKRELAKAEAQKAEATTAREAAAQGLDVAAIAARGDGPRASPGPRAQSPAPAFTYNDAQAAAASALGAGAGGASSSSAAPGIGAQLVTYLQSESQAKGAVEKEKAAVAANREARLKDEGAANVAAAERRDTQRTEQARSEFGLKEKRTLGEMGLAEKKQDGDAKRANVLAEADAHRIRVTADAEAEATKASSEIAMAKAQVELETAKANAATAAASAAMMQTMMQMVQNQKK